MKEFACTDFLPLNALVALKAKRRCSISLVIPALNEAKTVGGIVACARRELMQQHRLLDEIIVMDGNSSDGTPEIASRAGATVYRAREVRPDLVFPPGKGTSLWRSLFVAKGDILVYVDADIRNFDGRFVYGLVGALLKNPSICCAKAFYKRPLVIGKQTAVNQGGRVTELLVRPLLSLWYPQLAKIHQPLSGEYAFRRDALRAIPFSSGYGVEILMLLSVLDQFGLSRMAQVDMGTRIHRNRPLTELGTMSAAILWEFIRYLQEKKRITLTDNLAATMLSKIDSGWKKTVIDETRLPPAADIDKGVPRL